MSEVQNQFTALIESTRLNEMKSNKRNEDHQNFIADSRAQQQESRSAQRELEINQSTTAAMLALFAENSTLT